MSNAVLFVVMGLMSVLSDVKGEVFAVGGAAGWTIPQNGMVNYTEWAAMLSSLNVGDTLFFKYPKGGHNVVQVTEEDFRRCRSTNPIATFIDGETLVMLPKEGRYWFICGFIGHCSLGQKFLVDVVSPAIRAPAPAPATGSRDRGTRRNPVPDAQGPETSSAPAASFSNLAPIPYGPIAPSPTSSTSALQFSALILALISLLGCYPFL